MYMAAGGGHIRRENPSKPAESNVHNLGSEGSSHAVPLLGGARQLALVHIRKAMKGGQQASLG